MNGARGTGVASTLPCSGVGERRTVEVSRANQEGRVQTTSAAAVHEHTVHLGEVHTRYLEAGSGPPLLLLHGAGESATDWRWVMPPLARRNRVVALDLPCSTRKPSGEHSPETAAELVDKFLSLIGVENACVVGNSMGGLVALQLALSRPERVSALALVSSAGLGREVHPAIANLSAPMYGDTAVAWARTPLGALQRLAMRSALLFYCPMRIPQPWLSEQYELALLPHFLPATLAFLRTQLDVSGQRRVLLDELPRLQMPTLVVWGNEDPVFPLEQASRAADRLRSASVTVIPECGHLPQVEQPRRFAEAVEDFLRDHVGRTH
jgi:pimeloyl-ACP methyl ester carboxylesterase